MTPIRDVDIIAAARRCVGTKWRHAQRRPGVSIDCIGLIVATAKAVGYPIVDNTSYPLLPDGRLIPALREQFARASALRPRYGDIAVFWFDEETRAPQHVGIFAPGSYGLGVIHTYMDVGRCVEHEMTDEWRRRLVTAFRFRGVTYTLEAPPSRPSR